MLQYNDQHAAFNYMEGILSQLAFQGWYNMDSAEGGNLLFATDNT